MSNPQLIDYSEARDQFRKLSQARHLARDEFRLNGIKKAEAEHDYRKAMSSRLAHHRTEGKSVSEAETLAKGDCAHLARDRDIADVMMKTASHRIAELEADRAGLNRLAQWAERVDPAGVNE